MLFGWSPGIGDPTILGWLTVFAYFGAATLCFRAARANVLRRESVFVWHLLLTALLALGFNKQLDLQSLLTAFGRNLAQTEGWYNHRGSVQLAFIFGLVVLTMIVLIALLFVGNQANKSEKLALVGLVLLTFFVVVRAATFHHVDAMLGMGLGDFHLLELSGIALIAVPAFAAGGADRSINRRSRFNQGRERHRAQRRTK